MSRCRFLSLLLVCGQTLAAEPRVEIARQPMPLLLNTPHAPPAQDQAAATIPPLSSPEAGSEFGEQVVLVRQANWEPWRVNTDVSGYFTDNVALAPNRVHDWFLKYDVGVSYTNRIAGPWSMDVTLSQDFVRYDKFDSLDFDLTRAGTGVAYQAAWLADTAFFLRYNFYHLTEAGFGSSIMTSHSLSVGAQKVWQLSLGQQVFFGLASEPNLSTEPSLAQRHEHAAFIGWSLRLTDRLSTQVMGRVGYHVSPNTHRNDWNYIGLASVTYALTDWAKIGATGSISWNESNRSLFTYRNVMAGVFLGLQLSF